MQPSRFTTSSSALNRKSRLETNRPSYLPKPSRHQGSIDRQSTEARRPSGTSHRSSSAEPPRATIGVRLSREASATKIPLSRRSKSQQSENRYQSTVTPLRSSNYRRPTTTPQATPSPGRTTAWSWQSSLDRALAFVTVKDSRPVSAVPWQRAEFSRVCALLEERGRGGALVRPLTIARFVDVVGELFAIITSTRDARLNNDNYVTRLPHMCKRVLYPGTVSKSWLKAVNTLHAFPHALALIAYLIDLVRYLERPVQESWLYVDNDELASLRRQYLFQCWLRFQDPGHQFADLNEEYLTKLKLLLGNFEEETDKLQLTIKHYETNLEAESDPEGRAEEGRRRERRDFLLEELRRVRGERLSRRGQRGAAEDSRAAAALSLKHTLIDIDTAQQELGQVTRELSEQTMSILDRTRLLDQMQYYKQVYESKKELLEQIDKMLGSKETELVEWQRVCLARCLQYTQGLIHLRAHCPQLRELAVDEMELMTAECCSRVSRGVEVLKETSVELASRRAALLRDKNASSRKRAMAIEEAFTSISRTKLAIEEENQALEAEIQKEAAEAQQFEVLEKDLADRLNILEQIQEMCQRALHEMKQMEAVDQQWRSKLSEMDAYIADVENKMPARIESECARRAALVDAHVQQWTRALERSGHSG